jgi:hypothetical protein
MHNGQTTASQGHANNYLPHFLAVVYNLQVASSKNAEYPMKAHRKENKCPSSD